MLEPGADAFPDRVYVASLPPPLTQTCVIGPEAIRVRPDPLSLLPPTEEARIYAEREAEAPALTGSWRRARISGSRKTA